MSLSEKARQYAVNFEAVQLGMTKNKDGYLLKLVIHPNDVPESLLRDLVGSRYMVAMCKLDDQNEPVEPPEKRQQDRLIASAGMLCREEKFWRYLEEIGAAFSITSEAEAATALKTFLGIASRAELRNNEYARTMWGEILNGFREKG